MSVTQVLNCVIQMQFVIILLEVFLAYVMRDILVQELLVYVILILFFLFIISIWFKLVLFHEFTNLLANPSLVTAEPTLGLISSNSISISWDLSEGATGYEISVFNSSSLVPFFFLEFLFFTFQYFTYSLYLHDFF